MSYNSSVAMDLCLLPRILSAFRCNQRTISGDFAAAYFCASESARTQLKRRECVVRIKDYKQVKCFVTNLH